MKQVVLFILLSIMAHAASAQKYSFTLKGDIINVKDGKVCLYSPVDSVRALLTTDMKDGSICDCAGWQGDDALR